MFPLENFQPIFHTGTYGANTYYQLKDDDAIYQYAAVFGKTTDWIHQQLREPSFFLHQQV
jgi:hypothetical protein